MPSYLKHMSLIGFVMVAAAVAFAPNVSAHIVVKPSEAVTAGFQTFTLGAPNEQKVPVTKLKLLIPDGLKFVSPTQKIGWKIDIEKSGDGEDEFVKAITWSGGSIDVGLRDDFTFSAKVPDVASELQWKAYETYSDGKTVAWDRNPESDKSEDGGSGPASVTRVVTQLESGSDAVSSTADYSDDIKDTANIALYASIFGIVTGLSGIYLALRKN